VTEFVQAFKFRVRLTRSSSLGPTASVPPTIELASPANASTAPAPAPQRVGADGSTPVGTPGDQTDDDLHSLPEQIGNGSFQECQGLELEADIHDYLEGGRNDQIIRRVGRVKLQPVVLKRGMLVTTGGGYVDCTLWDWVRDVVVGKPGVMRYNGDIEALDPADLERVTAHWSFLRGLPVKVVGPQLNAKTGEIVIEELHIAHEGLRLEHTP
jgi:phage tail-like protein